jgi:hypothetical protein
VTPEWQPGEVAAIVANPFYAINIHPSLARSHVRALSESDWVRANARAISEFRAKRWLEQLLDSLQQPHTTASMARPGLRLADPYVAVSVHPALCEPHPPLVTEAVWISANERALEQGVEPWLRNLLSVLRGGFIS